MALLIYTLWNILYIFTKTQLMVKSSMLDKAQRIEEEWRELTLKGLGVSGGTIM
jgi:hypothetical protein